MTEARLRAGVLGLLVALTASACDSAPPPEWVEADGHRYRDLIVPRRGEPGFESVRPSRTGIQVSNDVPRAEAVANRHLTHGSGVALGDVDGDGWVDVFLPSIDGPSTLFRNLGDWQFEDVTAEAGVASADRRSTGATFADVDGDRDLDLVVTALGGPNSVFLNDGSGRFSEIALPSTSGSTTSALADVDGDGDLDLYVTNYKVRSAMDVYSPEERAFGTVVEEIDGTFRVRDPYADDFRVFERPDLGRVIYVQRAEPDVFYRNDGQGQFVAESFLEGRFRDAAGEPLTAVPDLFGLSARFHDVTGDGAPDLFVANDFEDPDHFWINDGAGGFRAAPALALRSTSNAAMAVDFSDIDRDGDVDMFEVDMLSRDRRLRMTQTPTHTMLPKQLGVVEDRPQTMRNALFLNRGDETFAQISEMAGVDASDWSWGTLFLDVDLDGFEDLLIATGHAWDIMDADTQRRLGSLGHDWREEFLLFPELDRPNVAFRNDGRLGFTETAADWGFADAPDVSHGLASADLDGDGDQDLVVTRLNAAPLLLRNRARAPRVAVRLVGDAPNTSGVGAVIRLVAGGLPDQTKEITAGGLYLSGADTEVTFAAGEGERHLEVVWRDGSVSRVPDVQANRAYEIQQASSEPGASPEVPEPVPFFEDVSDRLGHLHVETDFGDESRQSLLPDALSREGPGVTWTDLDGDGDPDLVVPSGAGGSLVRLMNTAGRFVASGPRSPTARFDQIAVLPVHGSDGTRLLVSQSSYEAGSPEEAFATPGVLAMSATGSPVGEPIPGDTTAVGPLASADVDGDGDLDLFVGGRVVPALYPLSTGSRLYLNQDGEYRDDPAARAVLRSAGMVTSATFSDVDGDGDPDLIAATEWGPIALFVNESGTLRRAGPGWGLDRPGRWTSVATGDLDGDGLPDIVATSFGRNVDPAPRPGRPLFLYAGDLDRSGSLDLVLAQESPELGAVAPLDRLPRLAGAIPSLGRQVTSFSDYASASLADLFGAAVAAVAPLQAESYEHMLFLNRGGRFDATALPDEAQLAPAMHVSVIDIDGDGAEDVFLSQNFFPTGPERARLDGGRGLWLRGDGMGGLDPVPGQESGIRVYGDGRGAAFSDFDGDRRLDFAVAQNAGPTRLFRNVGGVPGVRIILRGPPGNPDGVGAMLRWIGPDGDGPVREVKAGSGLGSVDDANQILGGRGSATGIGVRWPGGEWTETPVPADATEVVVIAPGASLASAPRGAHPPAP